MMFLGMRHTLSGKIGRRLQESVQFFKAFQEIVLQGFKWAVGRCCTPDNDDIQTGFDLAGQNSVDAGAKPATGTVSDHGITDFAAGGKANTNKIGAILT